MVTSALPEEEIPESSSERGAASTPPTSLPEESSKSASMSEEQMEEGRRPRRSRASVSTYNIKKLSAASEQGSRNVSGLTGRTLVADIDIQEEAQLGDNADDALDTAWKLPRNSPGPRSPAKLQRKASVKDRVKKAASSVMERAVSVLGKRGRGARDVGKKTADTSTDEPKSKLLRELDMGRKSVLEELELDEDDEEEELDQARPSKKPRLSRAAPEPEPPRATATQRKPASSAASRKVKKWQTQGLYCGQENDFDVRLSESRNKLKKKRPESASSAATAAPSKHRATLPLPMFNRLERDSDFIIPYDVFAPSYRSRGEQKPKEWTKLNKNRWIDDAKDLWRTEKLERSICTCQPPKPCEEGCGDDCWNRFMGYECDDSNCSLDQDHCSNRAFAELTARVKKGNEYDTGVEVVRTGNRGFGIRACRTFRPGQIIMEYSGEVITQEECERRMHNEYKNKDCYYLMAFEQGMIIDATKGSIARFVNHSCEPNSHMKRLKVGSTSRMALFAGDNGIQTGEELTYDYNFDNFGETKQACYCGAASCRGFLGPKEKDADRKKREKKEREEKASMLKTLKRKAGEFMDAVTGGGDDGERKKQKEDGKPAGWRGWVSVAEVKEELRREKKAKEEAEKSSSRAMRLAARASGTPSRLNSVASKVSKTSKKSKPSEDATEATVLDVSTANDATTNSTTVSAKRTHARTVSRSSKFTEEGLTRPVSKQSITTVAEIPAAKITEDHAVAGAEETQTENLAPFTQESLKAITTVKSPIIGNAASVQKKLKQSTLSFAGMRG